MALSTSSRIFSEKLLRDKRFNFGYDLSTFNANLFQSPSIFSAAFHFPLWVFDWNSYLAPHTYSLIICNFVWNWLRIKEDLLEEQRVFSAACQLPLEGFSCNSMFRHYMDSVWTLLVWILCTAPAWTHHTFTTTTPLPPSPFQSGHFRKLFLASLIADDNLQPDIHTLDIYF